MNIDFEGHIIVYNEERDEWFVHGQYFGVFKSLKLAKEHIQKNDEVKHEIQSELDGLESQYEAEEEARDYEGFSDGENGFSD